MGNQEGKLSRNFVSLPSENFPSQIVHGRSGSDRLVESSVHGVQTKSGSSDEFCDDNLFLPVYKKHADINELQFEVVGVIAAGAFGDVLQAVRKEDGILYAMKVMDKKKLVKERAVQQSKDEATIQDSVGFHPFIVKPFWFFQNRIQLFIVMEYIPCGELFALWKQSVRIPMSLVQLYVAELGMVLDFLHKSGLIYRDLKMENILIDYQGHLHVTDFGLAKRLKIGQRTFTICGTLQYIAPEVANAEPYGHAADWWSLGILMYALITGQFPVAKGKDHVEMSRRILGARYELSIAVTSQTRHCLAQLLEKSPNKRLQSLDSLKRHEFFDGLDFEWLYHRRLNPNMLTMSLERGQHGVTGRRNNRIFDVQKDTVNKIKTIDDDCSSRQNNFTWSQRVAALGGLEV